MGFATDYFFADLDKGTTEDGILLAEKWQEIFQRKELIQEAVLAEEGNTAADRGETDGEKTQGKDMDNTSLQASVLRLFGNGLGFFSDTKLPGTFVSKGTTIGITGHNEATMSFSVKKGDMELLFRYDGDCYPSSEETEDVDDSFDTGIYIFQEIGMALNVRGTTEIEFYRVRKKDRHSIRVNDITLTEFIEALEDNEAEDMFSEDFAESALRFMQQFQKLAKDTVEKQQAEEEQKASEATEKLAAEVRQRKNALLSQF